MKRRKEPLPAPGALEAEVHRAHREAQGLLEEYRWAYPAALQPSVVESAGSSAVAYSDPTGGTAGAKETARQELRDAAKALEQAANDLAEHRRRLERLMGRKGIPTIPRGGGARTATRAEIEESRRRQELRAAAGEGYGET